MGRDARRTLAGIAAALAIVAPALGQQAPESLLPPGFGTPPRPTPPTPAPPPTAAAPASPSSAVNRPETEAAAVDEQDSLDDLVDETGGAPAPPPELPEEARRSITAVGQGDVDDQAFGGADGRYLATLMQRLTTPIASRWMAIALRRALLATTPAPAGRGGADWVADRAGLLLRLGEADGARTLVQAVDVVDYTPHLRAVAFQTALATSDPAGLCPLPDGPEQIAGRPAWPMIRAMCAALGNDAASANAMIGRGSRFDPIDHALAEKLVAAAGAGRRVTTIDWTMADALTDWRYGLATALNVAIPKPLLDAAPAWFQAWLARAPMLAAADRVAPARTAAVLGPLSSADLVDLYARVADDIGDLPDDHPAARLQAAYRADDDAGRLAALRALWGPAAADRTIDDGADGRDRYASLILTARAAGGVTPARLEGADLDGLVAAMLTAGLDIQAERWAAVVDRAGARADRAWALLAVGATRPVVTITPDRVAAFADAAGTAGRQRAALLAAALGGLGRLRRDDAARIAGGLGADLAAATPLARALDRAVTAGEPGTVVLLAAIAMQSAGWQGVPAADFYRLIAALRAVGREGEARMIAAEAMTRT